MNETLRRAMFAAHLTEGDLATQLLVDPKTVRRWMDGRLPYPRHRYELVRLLGVEEGEIWPELREVKTRPAELAAVYPRRSMISHDAWLAVFAGAVSEITILAYSAGFLLDDQSFVELLGDKAGVGVRARVALGDPDRLDADRIGWEEGASADLSVDMRRSIERLTPSARSLGVELRLHDAILYNSIFRVDDQMLVNQHTYGVPSAESAVYHLRRVSGDPMFQSYLASFEQIWDGAGAV